MAFRACTKEAGDLLLEAGKLTEQQLEQVRRRQQRLNLPQHRALVDLNFASEEDAWRALAKANGLGIRRPTGTGLKRETLELVPIKLIFHYRLLPLGIEEDCLVSGLQRAAAPDGTRQPAAALGKRFKIVLATPSAIHAVIKKHFGLGAETIQKLREERGGTEISQEIVFDVQGKETDSAVEATVSAFVDQILQEALRLHATDIHLEPYADSIRLRYRVDGILETVPVPADMRHLHPAVVSRLKIMAGLNIAEKRLPHDGRIAMKTGEEEYDLRVSIVPDQVWRSGLPSDSRPPKSVSGSGPTGDGAQSGSRFRSAHPIAARPGVTDRANRERQNHHALYRPGSGQ